MSTSSELKLVSATLAAPHPEFMFHRCRSNIRQAINTHKGFGPQWKKYTFFPNESALITMLRYERLHLKHKLLQAPLGQCHGLFSSQGPSSVLLWASCLVLNVQQAAARQTRTQGQFSENNRTYGKDGWRMDEGQLRLRGSAYQYCPLSAVKLWKPGGSDRRTPHAGTEVSHRCFLLSPRPSSAHSDQGRCLSHFVPFTSKWEQRWQSHAAVSELGSNETQSWACLLCGEIIMLTHRLIIPTLNWPVYHDKHLCLSLISSFTPPAPPFFQHFISVSFFILLLFSHLSNSEHTSTNY